jgi:predicted ATPase
MNSAFYRYDESSRAFIDEENNRWSSDGVTWTPRIGNPKVDEAQHRKAAEMGKKKRESFLPEVEMPVVDDVYPDTVYRPPHYLEGRKIEPWSAIADWQLDYFLGSAVKYLARAGRKGDAATDIKKAIQFLNKKLELLGGAK